MSSTLIIPLPAGQTLTGSVLSSSGAVAQSNVAITWSAAAAAYLATFPGIDAGEYQFAALDAGMIVWLSDPIQWDGTAFVAPVTAATVAGPGPYAVAVTVTDGTDPVAAAIVSVTVNGATYSRSVDGSGQAIFALPNGTYTVRAWSGGYADSSASVTVASTAAAATIALDAISLPVAALPGTTILSGKVVRADGTTVSGVSITVTQLSIPPSAAVGQQFAADASAVSASDGTFSLTVWQGTKYSVRAAGTTVTMTTSNTGSTPLPAILVGA